MEKEIKSIRITSNNVCYGPIPNESEEVEQFLTITASGRVWFSARNYRQHCDGKGFCRKKQVSIGKWKAEFLFRLIENLSDEMRFATDVGLYNLVVSYLDGTRKEIRGSLIGRVSSHAYGEEDNVDLTRLIRRYIPVYGLWVFDSVTSPDYGGKKAIYQFAEAWEKYFHSPGSRIDFEEGFGRECEILGFQMDSGEKFISECKKRGCKTPYGEGLKEAVAGIDDIEVIGSGAFSYWRFLTHWEYMYHLGTEECDIFLYLMRRLKELTRRKGGK